MKRFWAIIAVVVLGILVTGRLIARQLQDPGRPVPGRSANAPVPVLVPQFRTEPPSKSASQPLEMPPAILPERIPERENAPATSLGRTELTPVTVEWVGPTVVQVGQPTDFALTIRNTRPVPAHQVTVHVRPAGDMAVTESKPTATRDGDVFVWNLGTLLPSQEKSIQVQLVVKSRAEVSPHAWVTFLGSSSATVRLRANEPKLTIKTTSPANHVMVGDSATFTLTVHNCGDGPANQVTVAANLSEGLEHARGRRAAFELGSLSPGESRTVQVVCAAKAGGEQKCDAQALARGDVKAQDQGSVMVLMPNLDLQVVGPALRYLERKATYTLKVMNRGEVPAGNVTVRETLPAGFKFVSASNGGSYNPATQTVAWFLGEMISGQNREVQLELLAVQAGDQKHTVVACTERGLNKTEVERSMVTRVEELSALLLETAETDDPIEVGKDTTYEVLITNAGSTTETNIKLLCTLPDKMEFKTAQGPTRFHLEGNVIVFEPLPKLAPRSDACYRIRVRAMVPGDVRFKTQVTSTHLVEPVIKTEPTRIYADQPAQSGK